MGLSIACMQRWWAPLRKHLSANEYETLIKLLQFKGLDPAYDYAFSKVPKKHIIPIDEIELSDSEKCDSIDLREHFSTGEINTLLPLSSLYFASNTYYGEFWFYDIDVLDPLEKELLLIKEHLMKFYKSDWEDFDVIQSKAMTMPEETSLEERTYYFDQARAYCFTQQFLKFVRIAGEKEMALYQV